MRVNGLFATPPIIPEIKYKRIGNLGRAIIKASKEHKQEVWLKRQLDIFFERLRRGVKCKVKAVQPK